VSSSREPVTLVALPDGQEVRAGVLARRWEESGRTWWYHVRLALWARVQTRDGSVAAEPEDVDFWVPAGSCEPVAGEDYGAVPTEAAGGAPEWLLETLPTGAQVVHRGDCAAHTGEVTGATVDMVRRAVAGGATSCTVCHPAGGRSG
jgi:hypothetical protein